MLRTSFIAMYKNLGVWAWPAFGRPLSKVAQQSSFQSLATPPASATGLWSKKTSKRGENKTSERGESAEETENKKWMSETKEETKDEEWKK